jgi:hypothetical protein
MKTQPLYRYLSLAALLSIWSCSSSQKTAQNAGEVDDLYGNSGNAAVYASNSSDYSSVAPQTSRQQQRFDRQQRASRNANPDYVDDQQFSSTGGSNTDEYYTELSARKLNRGLSADPGWNDTGTNAYTSGFANGYNTAMTSAYSWNRWGFNNTGFYSGLGLGLGFGGFSNFGMGFGSPFYSPFYGNSFAYSPFGYSPYGYDPFYSSYAYGGFGGFSPFYSPFYSNYYGGGYGGYYGNTAYVNNVYVSGADPYRARTYNRTTERSSGRYSAAFDNSPRTYNPNGGRSASGSASSATRSSDGYYARPSNGSSRGSYYYDNSSSSNGRSGSSTAAAPSYNSNSGNEYYARPRESSRGSYTPSGGSSSGGRGSYQQAQPSYQQPAYQSQSRSYNQPSYQSQQPSYSAPSRSYSAPSYSSGGGGGSAPAAPSGGGGRGPR